MNKKGDIKSLAIIIAVMIIIAIFAMIVVKVLYGVADQLQASDVIDESSKEKINFIESKTASWLDNAIFFTIIGLMIAIIISSIYIETHPAYTIVFIILLIAVVYLSGILSDIFIQFTEQEVLSSTALQFPKTSAMLGHNFPTIVLFLGVIVIIVLYGKGRRQNLNV